MSSIDQARGLRNQLSANWNIAGPYQFGQVASINTGNSTVGVYLDGQAVATTGISYLGWYAPTVGDVVVIGRMQGAAKTARFVIGCFSGSGGQGGPRVIFPTAGASPTGGPYVAGDLAYDTTYKAIWECSAAGSPGTWKMQNRNIGPVAGAAPTGGPYNSGDTAYDTTFRGTWLCTVSGSPGTWVLINAGISAHMHQTSQDVFGSSSSTSQLTNMTSDWALGGITFASNQFTVPVAGNYGVAYSIQWQNSGGNVGAGLYNTVLLQNGGAVRQALANPTSPCQPVGIGSSTIRCSANDTVALGGWQNSGANQGTNGNGICTYLDIWYTGP